MREVKKALNLGHKLDINNTLTKVWIVLLSVLLARNLHSFVLTSSGKKIPLHDSVTWYKITHAGE